MNEASLTLKQASEHGTADDLDALIALLKLYRDGLCSQMDFALFQLRGLCDGAARSLGVIKPDGSLFTEDNMLRRDLSEEIYPGIAKEFPRLIPNELAEKKILL